MDDSDSLRPILGFFAMMLGTLLDPIALPCYIACGLLIRKYIAALAFSIGSNVALHVILSVIHKSSDGGAETGSPDLEVMAASIVGAVLVTSILFFFAARRRKEVLVEKAASKQTKPDT
jgi:hypothetical protein